MDSNVIELPDSHFLIQMMYTPLPSFAELEREFGTDHVSEIFDGRAWERHASCLEINQTPGERIFRLASVPTSVLAGDTNNIHAWIAEQRSAMAPRGYYPAIHKEVRALELARGVRRRDFTLYAGLGDSTHSTKDTYRYAASAGMATDGRRKLDRTWAHGHWPENYLFLLVAR